MGGEALGPEGVQCPSVGEYQGGKMEVGWWVGQHPHRGRGGKMGWGFLRGKPGKGKTFEM